MRIPTVLYQLHGLAGRRMLLQPVGVLIIAAEMAGVAARASEPREVPRRLRVRRPHARLRRWTSCREIVSGDVLTANNYVLISMTFSYFI